MRSCIAALAVGCMLSAGCATASSWRDAIPKTATLEVSNRTNEVRQVVVRGASEGSVDPGTRRRFRWLAPGPADITALAKQATTETHRVQLIGGETSLWEIGTSLPSPPTLGDLKVTNQLKRPVALTVSGAPQGVVLAGDTRSLRDLETGDVTVTALADETGLHLSHTVTISEASEVSWTINAPTGQALVINDSAEYMSLLLDGRELGHILPGDQREVTDIAVGEHTFTAISVGNSVARHHSFTLQPEVPYTWSLSAERGTIEIVNRSGEALTVQPVTGHEVLQIDAGMSAKLTDIPPGARTLNAVGLTSQMPYEELFNVRPGQQVRWHVQPIATTIRVENTTRRPLELYVDGAWQAQVEAGSARIVGNLGPKEHALVAVSPDGRTVFRHTVQPPALRSATWRIQAQAASCRVENARGTAVMVFVDGRGLGEVPAGQTLTFTGLEVGTRLLEAVDLVTGRTLSKRARLSADTDATPPTEWLLTAPTGTLVVTNRSSEPLLTEGELTVISDVLVPDATVTFQLPTGAASVRLIGEMSGVAHSRDFQVALGAVTTWEVGTATGHLVVDNRLKEPLELSIDGQDAATVRPGASFRSGALPAGPHTLVASGSKSGIRHTARRMVGPRSEARWTLQPEAARLVVSNGSSEAVSVRIDGRPYGRIEAESRGGIGALVPGTRQVDIHGLTSDWQRSMSLTLLSGGTEVIELEAPTAVLVIENQSGEPLSVMTDDIKAVTLEPGSRTPINVAAGKRKVTATAQTSGHTQTFDIALAVGQSHHLEIRRARARLLVLNRSEITQTVRLADRVLGEVAPKSETLFDDLQPAHWWLTAYGPNGQLTHSEHRSVAPGETRAWVLSQKIHTKKTP
ncbi:MAG: hypothetical protein ACPGU1_04660 [Myxococcota bacterium]